VTPRAWAICRRDAIDASVLRAPFHVTHVDAHADLGLGDAGYVHLMSELLFREPEDRRDPGEDLADSNYLLFALGCRWLPGLDYIYNRDELPGEGPGDLMPYAMEGYRPDAEHIELPVFTRGQIDDLLFGGRLEPIRREPRVPFRALPWHQYTASAPFELICLARSPEYTPATCDPVFDVIRERFIDELAPAP
jgi:hypothetical protein